VSALIESTTDHDVAGWRFLRALSAKEFATATAREVVDIAVQVVGASSMSKRHELERLFRDVRTGPLHPPNTHAVLDAVGATALGQV
jgi:alkylation response protein AidB-like acyl-CoA dehydrogenase